MAITKGWIAKHTGLPSFQLTGKGTLTAASSYGVRTVATTPTGVTLLSDVGAQIGEPITYKHGGTKVLTRSASGHCVLTDATGRGIAVVTQTGGDERDHDPRVVLLDRGAVRDPLVRWDLKPLSPQGTLECRTSGDATWRLRQLAQARQPLWVLHNRALCQVRGCDVDEVRLIVPLSLQEARTARVDIAQRLWKIEYQELSDTGAHSRGPVVTWGEWEAFGGGWQNWSEFVAAEQIAGM